MHLKYRGISSYHSVLKPQMREVAFVFARLGHTSTRGATKLFRSSFRLALVHFRWVKIIFENATATVN